MHDDVAVYIGMYNGHWLVASRRSALGLHMAEDTESCARRSSSSLASL